MADIEPSKVLELLKIIISQANSKEGDITRSSFDDFLRTNIRELRTQLDSKYKNLNDQLSASFGVSEEIDVRWDFVLWNLRLLSALRHSLEAAVRKRTKTKRAGDVPPLSPDVLSVTQQKTVLTSVQLVVCLGICPGLLPGVGIPVESRSKYGKLLRAGDQEELSQETRVDRLLLCLRFLLGCIRTATLRSLVLPQHLSDFLAALCQLCYGPKGTPVDIPQPCNGSVAGQMAGSATIQSEGNLVCKSEPTRETVTDKLGEVLEPGRCKEELEPGRCKEELEPGRCKEELEPGRCKKELEPGRCKEELEPGRCKEELEPGRCKEELEPGRCKEELEPGRCKEELESGRCKEELESGRCNEELESGRCNEELESGRCNEELESGRCNEELESGRCNEELELGRCKKLELGKSKEELEWLLEQAPKPLLIRDLLLLQGGPRGTTTKTPRCPMWLRKASGRLLAQQLSRPEGIQHLLSALLQGQPGSVDWRKCDAIAQIIARCPHQATTEEYYKQVAPQLIDLLHMNKHQMSPLYIQVAVTTIVAMTTRDKDAAQKLLISPLLLPLLQCTDDRQRPCQPAVSEEELSQCVLDIHKVFVAGSEPHSPLLNALQPVLHVLFRLYCFVKSGVSHLRQPLEDILVAFLRQTDHHVALAVLQLMAFGNIRDKPTDVTSVKMSDHLNFTPAATGGAVITTQCSSFTHTAFDTEKWEVTCQCIVHLLKQLHKDGLTAEFFLLLLTELTAIVSEETSTGIQLPVGGSERERMRVGRNLEVLGLLAVLSEHLDPACFNSTKHILQLAQVTIERGVKVLENAGDETVGIFETETLTMAMGLLTAVLSHPDKLTTADRDRSKDLLPLLQHIATDHSDPTVQEMATDLRIAIATHGIVLSELAKQRATERRGHDTREKVQSALRDAESAMLEVKKSTGQRSAPLIEVLSSCDNGDVDMTSDFIKDDGIVSTCDQTDEVDEITSKCLTGGAMSSVVDTTSRVTTSTNDTASTSVKTSSSDTSSNGKSTSDTTSASDMSSSGDVSLLEQALLELCDSLVPVRGHALITLTRLLQGRDPATLARSHVLLTVFRENLDHPDTYIYLQAVSGLTALGDTNPDTVLPTLLKEYARGSRSVELRMKLGEAIVRICRRLGDIIPAYRDALLGALLCGVRDSEPLVRASCLSNLGDVCRLLRFSLGSVIQEVFEVTSRLLRSDPDPEVRKAAALFITLLLQGTDVDTVQVLDTVLRDLYRLLKLVMSTEGEQMVKVHAQLALEELDTISRRLLFPPQILTKKISVLHPP